MQIYDVLEQAQDGHAMANLAAAAGITEDQARTATRAVLPELAYAIERNTLSRGGLADLIEALGHGHHEQLLDMPRAWSDPRVVSDGDAILAHMLGSPEKVATLSDRAQRAAGLPDGVLRMLLPILAQLLMGAIARYTKGGLGDVLSRLPIPGGGTFPGGGTLPGGGAAPRPSGSGSPAGGGGFNLPRMDRPAGGFPMPPIPGGSTPGGSAQSDDDAPASRSGSIPWPTPRQDDAGTDGGFGLPRMQRPQGGYPMPPISTSAGSADTSTSGGGSSSGGSPFPLPIPRRGGDNPYGDLSDILRRGRVAIPAGAGQGAGGGALWNIVRSVLGGALGFGGRGVFGWLVQLIVMRWGWGILRRLLLGR